MAPRSLGISRNRVDITTRVDCPRALQASLQRWSEAFLEGLELSSAELSIVVVGDAEIQALNREWRAIDRPTDVLSFPVDEAPMPEGALRMLGDVVLSLETARARAADGDLGAEMALYLAHGILHLLGHDHHRPAEALRMAAEERRLLGRAGMLELAGEGTLTRRAARSEPPRQRVARRRGAPGAGRTR